MTKAVALVRAIRVQAHTSCDFLAFSVTMAPCLHGGGGRRKFRIWADLRTAATGPGRDVPTARTVCRRSFQTASRSFNREPGAAARIASGAPRIARFRAPGASAIEGNGKGFLRQAGPRRRRLSHAARSTSNAARLRASLLNSTAMRWIGWPRCRYLSA